MSYLQLLSVSALTIRESSSGNHLGQGQAVVKVVRSRRIIACSRKFSETLIVLLFIYPFKAEYNAEAQQTDARSGLLP